MSVKGIMNLYDEDGSPVIQRMYDCKITRDKDLQQWAKLFGRLYQRMYIQYIPFARTDLIKEDGTNALRTRDKEPPKKEIIRPKAVYTNIKTYEYK